MSIYREFCEEKLDGQGRLVDFKLRYPDNFNFAYDVVDRIAAEEPERRAIVWCNMEGQERIFSFQDLKRLSDQAANVFLAAGIRKGDRVMAILKRHYEYWYVTLALHKLGAVLIPATHMLTAADMKYRIDSAEIRAVVCTTTEEIPQRLLEVQKECPSLELIWTVQKSVPGCRNLTQEVQEAPAFLPRQETAVHEPMLMYFTSGTTGYPKGVVHDHSYPLAHIITARHWQQVEDGGLHFTVAETGWGKTSWGKIYGQWLAGSAVMVYDFDNFEPKQLVSIIKRYGVTTFCAPPTVYRYLVRKGATGVPSLHHASTAGEALNPEVFRRFTELTGLELAEGYGQTESTMILGNIEGFPIRPGSMGLPSPMYHVDLWLEDGSSAKPGEIGEIVVIPPKDGPQPGIFIGYHGNPALYKRAWRGGVYHTGDTAWRDEDGYFWFNGRIDDVIKTGGFRVGPFEIENVLMEHPAVMECAVIGVPDTLRGQAIKAVIILAPGYTASAQLQKEIREFCNSRVAEYKWLRFVEFADALPKTISGKTRNVELREAAQKNAKR